MSERTEKPWGWFDLHEESHEGRWVNRTPQIECFVQPTYSVELRLQE